MNKILRISLLCISSITMKINCAAPYDPTQHILQQAIQRCDAPAVVACLQANPRVTKATMQVFHEKLTQISQVTMRVTTFLAQSGSPLDRRQLNEMQEMRRMIEDCHNAIGTMLPLLENAYKTTVE